MSALVTADSDRKITPAQFVLGKGSGIFCEMGELPSNEQIEIIRKVLHLVSYECLGSLKFMEICEYLLPLWKHSHPRWESVFCGAVHSSTQVTPVIRVGKYPEAAMVSNHARPQNASFFFTRGHGIILVTSSAQDMRAIIMDDRMLEDYFVKPKLVGLLLESLTEMIGGQLSDLRRKENALSSVKDQLVNIRIRSGLLRS
jgi:hypothetical protein